MILFFKDESNEFTYKQSSFETACRTMFYLHREFVNDLQLKQVALSFFSAWNVHASNRTGQFLCAFCASTVDTEEYSTCDSSTRGTRNKPLTTLIKNKMKCPFILRYSKMHYNSPTKDLIYYKVRITTDLRKKTQAFMHTHPLSNSFYKRILNHSKTQSKIDLGPLKHALELLKADPRLNNNVLRKLLINLLPSGFDLNADFLRNFKIKAASYHMNNPNGIELDCNMSKCMLSKYNLKHKDFENINDPLKLTDFQKIYNNIMNSDVTTWKVVSFLQTCKRELPGFDYKIHYAQDGYPDGIML